MLGVRLDTELEERLAAVARTLHDDAYRREARRQSTRASARASVEDVVFWQDGAAWR
jgi:RHH-type rel operon transcriptional repressor/antitoxin RelB